MTTFCIAFNESYLSTIQRYRCGGKTVRGRGRGQKDKCGSGVQDTRVGQREDNDKTSGTKVPGVQGDWAKFAQTTRFEYIRDECGRCVLEFSTTRQQKL
jgi:hypothetical protein